MTMVSPHWHLSDDCPIDDAGCLMSGAASGTSAEMDEGCGEGWEAVNVLVTDSEMVSEVGLYRLRQ